MTRSNVLSETLRLYGWDENFANVARPVRALLFGEMVRRAVPIMQQYQSDLFHDVEYLQENLNGPHTFEWLIRPSGTNLNDMARIGVQIGPGEGAVFYRINVYDEKRMWCATFTEIPLDRVASLGPR